MPRHASPALAPIAEIVVELGEPMLVGRTRAGERRITPILGGSLRGVAALPEGVVLEARVLPGGADRQLVRPDGTIEIDARYDARTSTGAYILIHASGIRRVSDESVYFRVSVRFEAAAPELGWMQDALFIADGVREADSVRHRVYRVG